LIHFVNAMLEELAAPIVDVEILDPYSTMEFIADKLSIVDVKARDPAGQARSPRAETLAAATLFPVLNRLIGPLSGSGLVQ